jgi:hypothetical protein
MKRQKIANTIKLSQILLEFIIFMPQSSTPTIKNTPMLMELQLLKMQG